ncbi:MAG: isoprenylcysteine carboxylmethyltransferase family protein [Candidatus Korobacteraceae bacterium]
MWNAKFVIRLIVGVIWNLVIFGGLMFGVSGTLHWARAWWFLAVMLVLAVVGMVTVFRADPELLKERFKPPIQKGQPRVDRVLVIALLLAFLAVVSFIPIDIFHLHLLPQPDLLVSCFGFVLFIAGWCIVLLAMKANTFAALVVRHQTERHQEVIDSGVYHIVRHPMYAGAILFFVGMPLWLGSYAATLLAVIPIAVLAVRIVFEEQFLRRKLAGYDSYTQRVRYRLVPHLW